MEECKLLSEIKKLINYRLGHRKYKHLYRQYFRERLRDSYVRHNFLGYSEERSLARIDRENRLVRFYVGIV